MKILDILMGWQVRKRYPAGNQGSQRERRVGARGLVASRGTTFAHRHIAVLRIRNILVPDPDPQTVPLTNESKCGSGRPKNIHGSY
jgi:hypothetical protein